ncbi:hypothetical protein WN944_001299 [Citrus x changshan-huyou]|uniref:Uncharacterized protein n=1 Tax=Citrus x changshan-huyou TaxID=2935761 RepID=A0AAP0MH15_9ROSI
MEDDRRLSRLVSEAAFTSGNQVLGIIPKALKALSSSPIEEESVVLVSAKLLFICALTANKLLDLLEAYRTESDPKTLTLDWSIDDGSVSSKKYKLDFTFRL